MEYLLYTDTSLKNNNMEEKQISLWQDEEIPSSTYDPNKFLKDFVNIEKLSQEIREGLVRCQSKFIKENTKEEMQRNLKEKKQVYIQENHEFFDQYSDSVYRLISQPIDYTLVEPELVMVKTKTDQAIWEYLRTIVSVMPNSGIVGRRIKYFLKDKVSGNILGIFQLSSDFAILGCRDKYIGWNHDLKFKSNKINHILNLSVCVPLQSWGYLTGGKLMLMLSLSKQVQDDFKMLYGDDLIGVSTTSLYGKSSQYNRVKEFKFLGYTEGFGNVHIDKGLYEKIKLYLKCIGKFKDEGSNVKMTQIKNASDEVFKVDRSMLDDLGIDRNDSIRHGNPRGVYFGWTCDEGFGQAFLKNEITIDQVSVYPRTVNDIFKYWKERWFWRRWDNPEIKNKVLAFDLKEYRINDNLMFNF